MGRRENPKNGSIPSQSALEHFLPEEEAQFEHATQKTADFFVDVLSGGISLQELLGYPALKMRFFQITVDETARDVWLEMYKKVIIDMNMPSECIEEFWNWIEPLSLWMINHQTMPQIPRYPYQEIWTDLVEFSQCRRCY